MSQHGKNVDPIRRRAGLLSSLAKLYAAVQNLLDSDGSTDDALVIQEKLTERYAAYLDSQETAMVAAPDREETLTSTHITNEQRHQQAVDMLQAFIDEGNKSERSLHLRSLFSSGSSRASVASRKIALKIQSFWWKSSIDGQE